MLLDSCAKGVKERRLITQRVPVAKHAVVFQRNLLHVIIYCVEGVSALAYKKSTEDARYTQ